MVRLGNTLCHAANAMRHVVLTMRIENPRVFVIVVEILDEHSPAGLCKFISPACRSLAAGQLVDRRFRQLALASPAHEEYLCTRKRLVPHVWRDGTMIRQQVEVYQTETMVYLLRGNEHTACVSRERSKIHRSGRENCQKVGCGSTPVQKRTVRCYFRTIARSTEQALWSYLNK